MNGSRHTKLSSVERIETQLWGDTNKQADADLSQCLLYRERGAYVRFGAFIFAKKNCC